MVGARGVGRGEDCRRVDQYKERYYHSDCSPEGGGGGREEADLRGGGEEGRGVGV